MTFYKKQAKVMLSPVKVEKELKDSIIGVSVQLKENYTDTMIYLLELGVKAHLDIKVVERGGRGSSKIPVEVKEIMEKVEKKAPVKRFEKPSEFDITNYMMSKGMTINPASAEAEKFFNYYESNGWKVGKNPMKSWEAAARNWMKNNNASGGSVGIKPDRLATPDRTELFNEMGVGEDAPFYNPLAISGD